MSIGDSYLNSPGEPSPCLISYLNLKRKLELMYNLPILQNPCKDINAFKRGGRPHRPRRSRDALRVSRTPRIRYLTVIVVSDKDNICVLMSTNEIKLDINIYLQAYGCYKFTNFHNNQRLVPTYRAMVCKYLKIISIPIYLCSTT